MENKNLPEIEIDLMRVEDLEEVLEIEKRSFTNPWSKYAFLSELNENRFATYIVIRTDGKIVGYGGMWIIFDEAHVTNVAVLPEYRGMGIGELIMRTLIDLAKKRGAIKMTLEVRKSNHIAQNLYTKLGFQPTGIRRGYYSDNNEDAIIMWKDIE
ncbi:MAG: ribosomal protein S18-alanine N-acetyltransferase [Thermovenabulum sp.]|uniref:ribosomal protein S18-alanine N-acetyltransferase n=1 Tax=Thermovenabulum sp. TaxID=3100335 RepID=UPI003C79E569